MDETKFKFCLPTFLAVVSTLMVLFMMCISAFLKAPLDSEIKTVVLTQWVGVMCYWFGSSSGSASKSKTLDAMASQSNEEKK